jgi:hypothetical protein
VGHVGKLFAAPSAIGLFYKVYGLHHLRDTLTSGVIRLLHHQVLLHDQHNIAAPRLHGGRTGGTTMLFRLAL